MLESLKQKQEQKRLEQEKQMQEAAKRKEEEKQLISDIAFAQAELNELKKEHGIEEKEKGIKRLISYLLDKRDGREKVLISKKKYLWLCLLGTFGAHRFYAKQYFTAVLYLVLFWSGISFSMTLIDLMIVAPMKPDENGMIWM